MAKPAALPQLLRIGQRDLSRFFFFSLGKVHSESSGALRFCMTTLKLKIAMNIIWHFLSSCNSPRPGAHPSPCSTRGNFRDPAAARLRGGAALRAAWRFAQSRASARMLVPPGPPSGSSGCAADQHRGVPLLALRHVVSVSMALSACHRDLLTAVPQFSARLLFFC